MIKKGLIFIGIFFLGIALYAQNNGIEFIEKKHDFGKLEEGPQAKHTFKFKNTTSKPIKLTYVKASCGCTTPKWTKEEVKPGEIGEIDVIYNTKGRPNKFTKSITIKTNYSENPSILTITGNVLRDPNKVYYNYKYGALSMEKNYVNVGKLKSTESKEVTLKIKNSGTTELKIFGDNMPAGITFLPKSTSLKPNAESAIVFKVDGTKLKNSSGSFSIPISFTTNEVTNAKKTFSIAGNFEKIWTTEELSNSPKIVFKGTSFNGGTVTEGQIISHKFEFKNEGKTDLTINSVKASCGCTATAPKDKVVKPGETSYITANFNTKGKLNKQIKTITVRTNDIQNPTVILRIDAVVEKDPFHSTNKIPGSK